MSASQTICLRSPPHNVCCHSVVFVKVIHNGAIKTGLGFDYYTLRIAFDYVWSGDALKAAGQMGGTDWVHR